ncbi:MAG: hypothetical protein ABJC61_11805, partial [Acidobacteriota bacterium]
YSMTGRLASLLASALFVFYCTAVGVYLLLHPWFPAHRPTFGISSSGFFRGFVSGLGLVHLFAGLADIRGLARSLEPPVAGRPFDRVSEAHDPASGERP